MFTNICRWTGWLISAEVDDSPYLSDLVVPKFTSSNNNYIRRTSTLSISAKGSGHWYQWIWTIILLGGYGQLLPPFGVWANISTGRLRWLSFPAEMKWPLMPVDMRHSFLRRDWTSISADDEYGRSPTKCMTICFRQFFRLFMDYYLHQTVQITGSTYESQTMNNCFRNATR